MRTCPHCGGPVVIRERDNFAYCLGPCGLRVPGPDDKRAPWRAIRDVLMAVVVTAAVFAVVARGL